MSVQTVKMLVLKCDGQDCDANVSFNHLHLTAPEYHGWLIDHIGNKDLCPRCRKTEPRFFPRGSDGG